jgi:hypothetical protein
METASPLLTFGRTGGDATIDLVYAERTRRQAGQIFAIVDPSARHWPTYGR